MTRPRLRRALRLLLRLGLALAATLVVLEVALREILFAEGGRLRELGSLVRSPLAYSDRNSADFWKLTYLLADPAHRLRQPTRDPRLGWRTPKIEAGTYLHEDFVNLAGQRPLLLFGDSFAQTTERHGPWTEWLEEEPEGERLGLLNHGVGGYGMDQIALSFLASIEAYAEHDPIVVFSLLLDDDLDRSVLAFRAWPKPVLIPRGEDFAEGEPIEVDTATWLKHNPPGVRSYLWELVRRRTGLYRPNSRRLVRKGTDPARVRDMTRAIFARLAREVTERELEAFVLVFYAARELREPDWRESFLLGELERVGLPYVLTRTDLAADRERHGRSWEDYFLTQGPLRNHHNELGNRIAFQTLLRGLRGLHETRAAEATGRSRREGSGLATPRSGG